MVVFVVLLFIVLMLVLRIAGRSLQSTDDGGKVPELREADICMERLQSAEIPPGMLYEAAFGLYDDELSMEEALLWDEWEDDDDFDALDGLGMDC